jgi:hypothetical protein
MNKIVEVIIWHPRYTIRRYPDAAAFAAGAPAPVVDGAGNLLPAESIFEGNLLLNEGIQAMLDLLIGAGSPTAYNNANAQIGVGDSNTAEAAAQVDLQASTNKTWKAMEATYPSRSNQTVTFRSVFASADANYAWNEFSVRNGATADKNLNRKVSAQGTKASGQTWTVDVAITVS